MLLMVTTDELMSRDILKFPLETFMRKLIAFFVVAIVAVTANQAFAQCATCAGSAPVFSQPVTYGAPQVYSAPQAYSAPVQSYAAPIEYGTSAPIQYGTSAPIEYGTPVASTHCGGCCGGCGSAVSGDVMSGGMSAYSTQGLPPGAVVISDVVSDGSASSEGAVEGTVVGQPASVMGSSETVEPPAPMEDKAVEKLPMEGKAEGSATKGGDGT